MIHTSWRYESKSFDGSTTFEIEITLDDKFQYKEYDAPFIIKNPKLVDGLKFIHKTDRSPDSEKNLRDLKKFIYNTYIKPKLVIKSQSDALDDILASVSDKGALRDKKIDSIIGTGWNKIFGK